MKYVRYAVTTLDGKLVELARSYRNSTRFRSDLPIHANLTGNSMVKSVVADWCTKDEKYRIWRRCDHAAYEPLVDTLEESWIRR